MRHLRRRDWRWKHHPPPVPTLNVPPPSSPVRVTTAAELDQDVAVQYQQAVAMRETLWRSLQPAISAPATTIADSLRERVCAAISMKVLELGGSLCGGIVRDWFVRREAPNDVDCQFPSNLQADPARSALSQYALQLGFSVEYVPKGPALTLWLRHPAIDPPIEIDFVDAQALQAASPGVDCNVGNLCVTKHANGQHVFSFRQATAGAPLLTVQLSIEHALAKKFVFFYSLTGPAAQNENHAKMTLRRLKKYFSRGWTCLNNDIPDDFKKRIQDMLTNQHQGLELSELLNPNPEYTTARFSK